MKLSTRGTLFPALVPRNTGMLRVSPLHEIYWEESGNPQGLPVVFLHGGPGGGSDAKHRRFFDPLAYRIVLYDQRGCGRSRPSACIDDNTTWLLLDDIETLRRHLAIERWVVAGGSWGSTLALAYAQRHPEHVAALILRGVFTFTARECAWFLGQGAARFFPEIWQDFITPIPPAEREDILLAYYRRLVTQVQSDPSPENRKTCLDYSRHWSRYECRLAGFSPDPGADAACWRAEFTLPFARLEAHYLMHRGFFADDGELLTQAHRLAHIPTTIVHGRYDVICPLQNAWDLANAMPHAQLNIVPDAGHSAFEPGIIAGLIAASEHYRSLT